MSLSPTPQARIWNQPGLSWLFSLRVGIVLLVLVTLASIAGTLIEDLPRAQALIYYSWWYRALLLLLAISIACSTYRTIVERLLPARRPHFRNSDTFYETVSPSTAVPFSGQAREIIEAFEQVGFRTAVSSTSGYAWTGKFGRWGAPVSHVGFIIVLVAGFLSKWTAREGYVEIPEGQAVNEMVQTVGHKGVRPLGFIIACEDFETGFFPQTRIASKFISTVSIYENDAQWVLTEPVEVNNSVHHRGWSLHQTEYAQTPEVRRLLLSVGHTDRPSSATVELSPGQARALEGISGAMLALSDTAPYQWSLRTAKGETFSGVVKSRGAMSLGAVQLRVEQFEPDFIIGEDRKATSRTQELKNPALRVSLIDEASPQGATHWLFLREDLKAMMHNEQAPYQLELLGVEGDAANRVFRVSVARSGASAPPEIVTLKFGETTAIGETPVAPMEEDPSKTGGWRVSLSSYTPGYVTTITLTRNPAIPLAYAGCAIIMLGLMISFFVQRREVWFWVDEAQGRLRIAAQYRHPQTTFDSKVQKIVDKLPRQGT